MATDGNYQGQEHQQQGGLSREPSYARGGNEIGGISDGAGVGSGNDANRLSNFTEHVHPIKGTSHIPGEQEYNAQNGGHQQQGEYGQEYQQGQGQMLGGQNQQQEYGQGQGQDFQNRENANVVPHEQYVERTQELEHPRGLDYGQSVQTGEEVMPLQRSMGQEHYDPAYQQQQHQDNYGNASGYQSAPGQELDAAELQPSRSYSTHKGQTGGLNNAVIIPNNSRQQSSYGATNAGFAGVGAGQGLSTAQQQPQYQQAPAENAIAVGTGYEQQPQQLAPINGTLVENQQRSSILSNGPTTAVLPTKADTINTPTSPVSPIAGGGLAAALATSGHSLTPQDKKALKSEIKNEAQFEKQLASESKRENADIASQLSLFKASVKNADKSNKHEAGYRKTYDKAIQREIKAKKYLLKVQNEYNKVAADLESATKEMEIRRNQHVADVQTRDADQKKLEDLRLAKGRHDMEREAQHGDSLTKQAQAKRALSMSKRRSVFSS